MTTVIACLPCSQCHKDTLHVGRGINHAFHLLASVISVGVWVIGWFITAMTHERIVYCVHCSSRNRAP